ncbi:MAG: UDP-galactopyranose mutase [Paludibacteraceae bacterium]|nr:UDP-galactopyranose mutase [Paludibacteraceae bacterium]
MFQYDFLIVGAGLFGAVFAHEMNNKGKKCLVVEQRNHTGGNIHNTLVDGIHVHEYGAHIFHTDDKNVWDYVNRFVTMNRFTNSPLARNGSELFNLPFNMNTFHQLWGVVTPAEAWEKIESQCAKYKDIVPQNLEEQALKLVGHDIYEKLIKHYTEKQWGRRCDELPAFIIRRVPLRFTYDNNYFNDPYQGIPVEGYNQLIDKLLEGCEVILGVDYLSDRQTFDSKARRVLYTGCLDAYFDYRLGELEYRSLRFEHEHLNIPDYQGNAVVNYTGAEVPYTRIIEHKHFEFGKQDTTIITREFPDQYERGKIPYYPVNDEQNTQLYEQYRQLAACDDKLIIGGRLAMYKYFDMDDTIAEALKLVDEITN